MSDKMVINTISKTYFIIISFILFLFITSVSLVLLLQKGVHLQELSFSNVNLKQLYIKWDKKLDLSIKELYIYQTSQNQTTKFNIGELQKDLRRLSYVSKLFNSITIEKIYNKDFKANFHYKENSKGFLHLKTQDITLDASLSLQSDYLVVEVEKLKDTQRHIDLHANLLIDLKATKLFTRVDTHINEDANLTLYGEVNVDGVAFKIKSHDDIKDLKYLIQMASLPSEIKFWTQDAIDLESLTLEELSGKIEFNKLEEAYKNIYVKAKANSLTYTYNTKLDGIHTTHTDVLYKKGVLYLYPRDSYSYSSHLGESWLKIDFTQPQEILTLHLLFDGMLDEGMLEVLKAYKINLPFYQHSGSMKTDLTLTVNLISIDVDAHGTFYTQKANFDYLKLNIDVSDTSIELNNYDVKIPRMRAKYKDVAVADVNASYDTKAGNGVINFSFDSISLGDVRLENHSQKLKASYNITPLKDSIDVSSSYWNINNKYKASVEALSMPFDLKSLSLGIPATFVSIDGIAKAFVEGSLSVDSLKTALKVDVLSLDYNGVSFSQSNTPIEILYDQNITLYAPDTLHFSVSGTDYAIEKPKIKITQQEAVLKTTKLSMGKYITTKIYAKHNFNKDNTHVSLSNFIITDYKQQQRLYSNNKILLSISNKDEKIVVKSKELGAEFTSTKDGWSLHANSLSLLANNSALLSSLHINSGELKIHKSDGDKYVHLDANIRYPYKILTKYGVPTEEYEVSATLEGANTLLEINKNTTVNIGEKILIENKASGINVHEIIRALQDLKKESIFSENNQSVEVSFEAKDSYLYLSKDRKVVADSISLQYINDILTAQLYHKNGEAGMRLEGEKFHVYGKNFSDVFMEELFSLSRFKGGLLDFSFDGTLDEYAGIFYIKDSIIMDYKLLNNVLAFINTVPSLVTFSLPGYSSNGLLAKEAYLNFKAKDTVFNLSDIYLESKELTILGNGKADTKEDLIDVTLNLKTDLGSDASKIPLVGYILFDEESVSTSLKITGKLSNPSVDSQIAKDMVVAPLNIIKRTLTLPYNLITQPNK